MDDTPSWKDLPFDRAQQFHAAYVASHSTRLQQFLEQLTAVGFSEIRFDSMADVDTIWDFALAEIVPPWLAETQEEKDLGSAWFPTLTGLEVSDRWPLWYDEYWTRNKLCVGALSFISGVAACVSEVMLRSWEAEWVLAVDGLHVNRTVLGSPGMRYQLVEPNVARWYAHFGPDAPSRFWTNMEKQRQEGPAEYVVGSLSDVEIERFDDPDMPNWFHATISPEFTAAVNDGLIDRFVAELLQQAGVVEAYRSDTEWVAVRTRRRRTQDKVQALANIAWQTAKIAHPPISDSDWQG